MQLGHLRAPDRPSAATRRLASRPSSGLWTDDLATHRRAPPPPTSAPATAPSTAPSTPKKSPLRSAGNTPKRVVIVERRDEKPTKEEVRKEESRKEEERPATPPPAAQTTPRRASGPRKARPSYPPQSPSQRARSSISPPRTLVPAQPQPAQAAPRAPSPRPKSTSPTPSPTYPTYSILDRPHPNSRPRSVSPPSSILVTPTETTFVLPAQVTPLAFPVPKPTPPTSPTATTFSQPQTPKSTSEDQQRTPTQTRQRPVTLHSIQYHDLADLARLSFDEPPSSEMKPPPLLKLATQGKRPVYNSANAQFSALVLVKSNTPSIYDCQAASASCSSLSASLHQTSVSSRGHMRTQSHGAPRTPVTPRIPHTPRMPGTPGVAFPGEVPSISVTAPTPSSPRFSFSALFPPKAPKSPLSPKRPTRQRRVSAEASQWAWGAKRGSRQSSATGSPAESS